MSNPAAHFSVRQPPPQKKSQQTSSQSKLPRRGRRTTEPLTNFTGPKKIDLVKFSNQHVKNTLLFYIDLVKFSMQHTKNTLFFHIDLVKFSNQHAKNTLYFHINLVKFSVQYTKNTLYFHIDLVRISGSVTVILPLNWTLDVSIALGDLLHDSLVSLPSPSPSLPPPLLHLQGPLTPPIIPAVPLFYFHWCTIPMLTPNPWQLLSRAMPPTMGDDGLGSRAREEDPDAGPRITLNPSPFLICISCSSPPCPLPHYPFCFL